MAYKARHKFLQYPGINFKNHMFSGLEWPFTGKNGEEYFVTLYDKGFGCSCPGFTFHGKCRHINYVGERMAS